MIREKAFLTDFHAGRNAAEAAELKWWILFHLRSGGMSADEIYAQSECGDIAMYLALHELVINNLIAGVSPYDEDCPPNHNRMFYSLADNGSARFFSDAAVEMHERWNPERWNTEELLN